MVTRITRYTNCVHSIEIIALRGDSPRACAVAILFAWFYGVPGGSSKNLEDGEGDSFEMEFPWERLRMVLLL